MLLDYAYPQRRSYSSVFSQKLSELNTIDGTCIYCRRKNMPLIMDAHDLYSCPECLALDLYIPDNEIKGYTTDDTIILTD